MKTVSTFLKLSKYLGLILVVHFLVACDQDILKINVKDVSSISGKVEPFTSSVGSSKVAAQSNCPDVTVKLFEIDDNGFEVQPEITKTKLGSDGTYTLRGLSSLNLGITTFMVLRPYIIQASGCGKIYSRLITKGNQQDITYGTSVVSYALASTEGARVKPAILNSKGIKVDELFSLLRSPSGLLEAYNLLKNNTDAKARFYELFGGDPSFLEHAAPRAVPSKLPAVFNEGESYVLDANAYHWESSYSYAYEWKKGNSVISTAAQLSYTPGANDQIQNVEYTLTIGQDNGSGFIDPTQPTRVLNFSSSIANTLPATVPSVTLASSALTSNPVVVLQMLTGADRANCASFSRLAITENTTTKPSEQDFISQGLTCTDNLVQNITYPLQDVTNEVKNIRVWAQDAQGNISESAQLVTMTLDASAPTLNFTGPAAGTQVNTTLTVTGTCEDSFSVNLSGTGLSAPLVTPCTAGGFSQVIALAAGEGTKAITISQVDGAGNTTSVHRNFINDTLAPLLTYTSPAASTEAQSGVVVNGTCESGYAVNLSGAGLMAPIIASCTEGVFSQAINFSAGDGIKSITVAQTDAAGNTGSAERSFIKDSAAPVLTIASPAADTQAQTGVTIAGTCEAGYTVNLSGAGLASPATTACGAGTFSQVIVFTAGDGSKGITVSQTDAAGNTASASRSFIKDTVAPVLTISSPAVDTQVQNGVTITGTCETGYTVNLSGAGLASPTTTACSAGTFSQAILFTAGDGSKGITVSQTDVAGNTGSATRAFIKDNAAPALVIASPAVDTEAQNGVTIAGTCEAGYTVDLSGVGLVSPSTTSCAAGTFSQAIVFTAGDGSKAITLSQTDTAGNTGSVSRTFIKDNVAPVLVFSSPAADTQAQNGVTITGTCEAGYTVDLSGAGLISPATTACAAGTFSQAIVFTAGQGAKAITVSQTDAAGNTGNATRSFIRDTSAPVLTFSSPAADTQAQNGVTITGTCEAGYTVNLSGAGLASPATAACGAGTFSQAIVFTAGDGSKAITVAQTDAAGNTGSATRFFIKDTSAPVLAIASPAVDTQVQTGVTLTGTCEAGYTINLSGAGLASPTTTLCLDGTFSEAILFTLGDGSKAITLSQTDAAGNTGSVSRTFIKDNVAPVLVFTAPAANTQAQNGVTITGTCEAGYTINLSGAGLASPATAVCAAGTFSQAIVFTAGEGAKAITVAQTDAAGNTGSASRGFIKDTLAPVLTFTSPAVDTSAQNGLTITGTCEAGYTINLSGAGLASPATTACAAGTFSQAIVFTAGDGAKSITASQTDAAGNTGTANRGFIKDTTQPALTFTTPAGGTIPYTTVVIGGACETGLIINVSGAGLSAGTTATCVAGAFTQSISLTLGEGVKAVTIGQTDLAGNATTVSRNFDVVHPTPVAVADNQVVVQWETLTVLGTTLISNDTTLAGSGPLTVTSVSNAVGGTLSFDAGTGVIQFVSTGFEGQAAGFDYVIENIYGKTATAHVNIDVQPLPAVTALVFGPGEGGDLADNLAGYQPPSMEDVFSQWGRFTGANWYPSGVAPEGEATSWSLLTDPYRINCLINSTTYTGFVSTEALDYYTHEATLTSTSGDDDSISLVVAFTEIEGVIYTLNAFRSQGGNITGLGFALTYREGAAATWLIQQKSVDGVFKNPDLTGWSNRKSRVRVERQGDIINIYASNWDTDTNNLVIDPTSQITIDLNSDERLHKFKGPKPYGYGSLSQANSSFLDISVIGGLDPQYIYDLENGDVYEYQSGVGYVLMAQDLFDLLGYPRYVTNPNTGVTYYLSVDRTISVVP